MALSITKNFLVLVTFFLLVESGLRLAEFLHGREVPRPLAAGEKILVIGESPFYASPLSAFLAKRYPGRAPQVVSVEGRWENPAELLERLPALLERYRPRALVVMSGEAAFWNRRLLHRFLKQYPGPLSFLYRWKTVQLVSRAFSGPDARRLFDDVAESEFPTLAMRWAGYLNSHPDPGSLSAGDRTEAVRTIEAWLSDPRSGTAVVPTRALLEQYGGLSNPAGAAVLDRYFGRGGRFNFPLHQWLAAVAPSEKRMDAFSPPQSVLAHIFPFMGGDENTLREAMRADAGDPAVFGFYAAKLLLQKRAEEARGVFVRGLRENPFYSGGEPPIPKQHPYFSSDELRALLAEAMPPPASGKGKKPGLVTLAASFAPEERILEWNFHELIEIVRLARRRNVPILLQTYPPDSYTSRERASDAVIRQVALALNVPVADTSSELSLRWGKSNRSAFYGSDQLSETGNRLVAEILAESLGRLLPP